MINYLASATKTLASLYGASFEWLANDRLREGR